MSVNQEVLDNYSKQVYNKEIVSIEDNSKIFEALCESIADEYPESQDIIKVKEEFSESNKNAEDFFKQKFDEYVDSNLFGIISQAHQNKWIKYRIEFLEENI
jgi:tetrahydromethanopterin S-methyltransferase subunit A